MSGTKMVLRNCENKKYKRKTGEKAHKIKEKWLVSAGKRYPDLSENRNYTPGKPVFMRAFRGFELNCLYLAKLLAVKTNPMVPISLWIINTAMIKRSSFPIRLPAGGVLEDTE